MNLYDYVLSRNRRLVAFPAVYPAVNLVGSSVRDAASDAAVQVRVLRTLRERLQPDIIFAFPDRTVEAEALGMDVEFFANRPPSLADQEVPRLELFLELDRPDPESAARMPLFLQVAEELSGEKEVLYGASVTGPLTLLSQLVRGESWLTSIGLESALREALGFATAVVGEYASALASRSRVVMVVDPVATVLRKGAFSRLYLPYLRALFGIIRSAGAAGIYHVCGDVSRILEEMGTTGAEGILFDGGTDLPRSAERLPMNLVLLGNLGRGLLLHGSEDEVASEVRHLLRSMKRYPNFVVSTGCDVSPDTPLRNLEVVVEETRRRE